ncbi:MAG: NADPH:quinone reductase [Candidatus Rokubacteria bacterium]|nr:NADPH:quinone reductase [Candidatus Rokubacteria bacterium]
MKAVWYERQGPAREVLVFGELPTPEPGPGEVLVRLHASGVNPSDCNRRAGRGHPAMEFPRIVPDSDGAGVVDAVGPGAPAALLGRRVWLYNGQRGRALGTAAEYIALDADLVSPLPDGVDFAAGATLGIPCMTAHVCLFADGEIRDRNVLVTGGAGAVGHYAIQLAGWRGARVIATVSSEAKAAHARAAGADAVIDYRTTPVAERVLELTGGRGVDRIVEVDFGGNLAETVRMIAPNGVVAAYASRGREEPPLPFYALMRKCVTLRPLLLPATRPEARRQAQVDIGRWLAEGRRLHAIAAAFPLARTVDAHEMVERGGKLGTVVVRCAPVS